MSERPIAEEVRCRCRCHKATAQTQWCFDCECFAIVVRLNDGEAA